MKSHDNSTSNFTEDEAETTKENILKSKMNTVFEPMISQMLITQPKDPVGFMLDWLKKISFEKHNVNLKDELNNLRKLNQIKSNNNSYSSLSLGLLPMKLSPKGL